MFNLKLIFFKPRKIDEIHFVVGGKDLYFEKHRMDRVNIVICTPGRLLQHMDENPLFDCTSMQVRIIIKFKTKKNNYQTSVVMLYKLSE